MRMHSVTLAKEANNLINVFYGEGTPKYSSFRVILSSSSLVPTSMTWLQTCQALLSALTSHITHLNDLTTQCAEIQDKDGCLSLRYSTIISLTTLAQMGYVLSRNPAWETEPVLEARKKCVGVLRRIMSIVSTLEADEFRFLDPLSNVCLCIFGELTALLTAILVLLVAGLFVVCEKEVADSQLEGTCFVFCAVSIGITRIYQYFSHRSPARFCRVGHSIYILTLDLV